MGTGVLGVLFTLAKLLLPIILKWVSEAQRAGIVSEGEQRVLGLQAIALVKELGVLDELDSRLKNMSDADLDALVTGVPRPAGEDRKP